MKRSSYTDNATYTNNKNSALKLLKRTFSFRNRNNNRDDIYTGHLNYDDNDIIWKGMLPVDHYQKLVGPNPQIIHRKPRESVQLNQQVHTKHLIPPPIPTPGIS